MNILLETIVRRVFDRIDRTAERVRRPAVYRHAGGGLMSTIAARGILSLALRWPALAVLLILSVLAARVMSAGRTYRTTTSPGSESA